MACCWLLAMSTSALALSWEQAAAPDGDPVFTLRHAWVFDPAPANRNGKGDAGERVFPRLRLLYDGSAAAQNVTATFATGDPDITVVDGEASYASWPAGQGRNMGFKIRIDPGATTHTAEATVTVAADSPSGGPWTYDVAIEIVGGSPVFVRRSDWVFDPPPGNRDQKADGGERVFPRLRLINRGSVDAETVVATFTTDDPDITVVDGEKTYASWPRGQARNVGFKIDIAKTATTHTANATVTVSAGNPGSGPWVYDVAIDIVRGSPAFVPRNHWVFDPLPANRDGVANAGERVFPRIRLVNNGSVAAESVVAIFTTDDPDIIIADGDATYVSWPVRRARTVGFKINIVPSAATHTAQGTVTVTAGNPGSGPWTANVTIDIVGGQAVSFAQRSSWVRDAATGDGDRLAEPGERVEIRSRLLHDGFTDGENVVVTLGSSDENVTVVSGTLPQGAWPAGEARNNVGLVVDLGSGVGSAVQFVMDVTADNGGSWEFTFTLPIAPQFALRNAWIYDPPPRGNGDGVANAGETVQPRIRLRNDGPETLRNVRVSLLSGASDITAQTGEVVHDVWAPGEAKNSNGLMLAIARGATARDVQMPVRVTADGREPWETILAFSIEESPLRFESRTAWSFDAEPGGNRDGIAQAGERVAPRFRMRHAGESDAHNVTVEITTSDDVVRIVQSEVRHATWPAGAARNNVGLV